jgi:isopenicillin N synthase-like dioxygenase
MKTNIKELNNKGYVNFVYPQELRKAVDETIKSWVLFCNLSNDTKLSLPYSNNADGVGYELKDGLGNKADKKENFDVAMSGSKWLEKHANTINNPIAFDFIDNATKLVQYLKPTVLEFARESEKFFDINEFADEVDKSDDAYFIRFIHYFGDRMVSEETASAHTDQSAFTLHLFESAKGLQCLDYNKHWQDMPVSSGETVIIPSMQMQLRTDGKIKALCHRVIANDETAVVGRYSAVCFVQLKNTPKYDKAQHGRLQEKNLVLIMI